MRISLGCIAYNEERDLPEVLRCFVAQDYPHELIEVILIDSMSTDRTRAIMEEFAAQDHGFHRVTVLENKKRVIPAGCNVLLDAARGDVFFKIDGHAQIPPHFVSANVEVLQEGHKVVGGQRPTIVSNPTPWQETLLATENSLFGSSVASYRRVPKAGPVDSLFHPAYSRDIFEKVGRFDERLLRTEDNDMSYRIRQAGFEIWFDPRIVSYQKIRPSFKKMVAQKHANGYWIGRTLFIQPGCIGWYHLVPLAFVCALVLGALLCLCGLWQPLVALVVLYAIFALLMGVAAAVVSPRKNATMVAIPFLFFVLHVAYGAGTARGILRGLVDGHYRRSVAPQDR